MAVSPDRGPALRFRPARASEGAYEQARALRLALFKENDTVKTRQGLAPCYEKLGNVYKALRDLDKAREAYENNRRIRQALILDPAKAPPDFLYDFDGARDNLSVAYQKIGSLELALGDKSLAENAYRQSLELAQGLVSRDPGVEYLQHLSNAFDGLGAVAEARSKLEQGAEARRLLEQAGGCFEEGLKAIGQAAAQDKDNPGLLGDLAYSYGRLGHVRLELGECSKALELYRQRVEIRRQRLARDTKDATARKQLANAYGNLAYAELLNRHPREAIAASRAGLELDREQLWIATNLAHGYLFDNQFDKAKAVYLENKDKKINDKQTFADAVLDDFKEFRKNGVAHPDMEKVERLLKKQPK